jgi:hypothetical protein
MVANLGAGQAAQEPGPDPDWDELGPENHRPQLTPATGAR